MRHNTKKGFTLVELLVVIAILAILATVSVVGYTSFIEGASLKVDEDLATQLNHFLAAYKVNNRGEITPDNIWEVTDDILELGGLEELQAQTDDYHFFYDFKEGEYIVKKDSEIAQSGWRRLVNLFTPAAGTNGNKAGLFIDDQGKEYFLVDTTGSDLAIAVRGFYTLDGIEGEKVAEQFGNFLAAIDNAGDFADELQALADNTVFVTSAGNFVTGAKTTHTNLYIHSEATYVDNRTYVVSTDEETKGQITNVVTLDEETPIIVVNTNTTIVIPEGVMLPTYSLNVGVSTEGTEVKIVIESNNWDEIESTVDAEFTNENITIVINGREYKLVEEGDQIVTNDENKTPVANLGSNFPLTDFNLAVKFVENKVVNTLTESGESANSGYVALDIAGGFTFNFIDVNQTSGGPASKPVVDWDIVSLVVDGAVVEKNIDDYIERVGNTFTFVRDKGFLPKVDKVVVKATSEYDDENGETKTFSKEYTVDVVRVKSVGVTVGGDDVLVDGKANLLCNSSNGATLATNFNVVTDIQVLNAIEGIVLDASANLSFTPSDHVHTQACCPHEHDESCNGGCNHDHSADCVLQCSHSIHNDECCGHKHTSACYSGGECTHVIGGTHTKTDGSSCYADCAHTKENTTGHTNTCSDHYIAWIKSGKDESIHTDDCCGHVNGTYHTSACGGKTGTCKYQTAGSHEHTKSCCMYQSNTRGIDFKNTSDYCAHIYGYENSEGIRLEYHIGSCGTTCTHFEDGEHESTCTGTLICGHDVEGHVCNECLHGTEADPHDANCQSCEFACTGRQDCLICTHDCATAGCLTYANCKYGSQSAVLNGTAVTGNGNASGTLTVNIGEAGSYYSTFTADINFYGAFDVDSNNNITHLGSVAVDATTHTNAIRVEDLFGNNIPTNAVIAIFGEIINPDQDDIINPNRILLANAEEAEKYGASFWVADNIIEYKGGAWEEIKFYGEGEAYIAVITDYNVDDYGNLTGVRTSKDIEATVVVAKNVRDYADFDTTGGSNVILNDIKMPQNGQITFNGGTIYGNHNTFDIQSGVIRNVPGIIILANTNMQDLRVVGALYPKVAISAPEEYGTNAIAAMGNVTITNCYIANTRAPLCSGYENAYAGVDAVDNVTVIDTVLFGGAYANVDLRDGTLAFEGTVITINQPHTKENDVASVALNDKKVGLGITVWAEAPNGTKIVGVKNLVQYNFIPENYTNIPNVVVKYEKYEINETLDIKSLFTEVFGNSAKYGAFHFGTETTYINAAIIGEDLDELATNPVLGSLKLPSGDRTGLKDNVPEGYGKEQYSTSVVNGAYNIYLHMYGVINSTQKNQDMFTASQGAEYTYSPWIHTVNGEYVPAYDFGSDNSIIAQ